MDGQCYEDVFLQPQDATQRRYEALRAIFVEGESAVDVAKRIRIPHGTVRNWSCEFRKQVDAGCIPPFFFPRLAAALLDGLP